MLNPKTSLVLPAVFLLGTAGAFAQEAATFTELSAERIGAEQVMMHAIFQGGACQEAQPAETDPGEEEGMLSVTIPTVSTAEVCTLQVVEIEIEETIDAGENIATLDVTVLGTDGEVQVEGSTQIGAGGGDPAEDSEGDEGGDSSNKNKSDSSY
jgi:hypothetical protein